MTDKVPDASRKGSFIPKASIANDGWSTEDEATATCYCGAVQLCFPLSKPGYISTFVCHCSDCRKITASMFSTGLIIINTHLKHLRGQDNLAKFSQSETIGSGNVMSNYFCKTCGSLMYRTSEVYEGISILRLGTVDDFSLADTALRPHIEQWTKHRVGWLDDVENVERSEDQFQPRNLNEGEL